MSIKSRVFAAAATLMLAGAALTGGALAANAETQSCGASCVELFSSSNPQLILDDQVLGQASGTPLTTSAISNSNQGEDFIVSSDATVAQDWQAGLVTDAVALHYGCEAGIDSATCTAGETNDVAFEFEYAPNGAATGECAGIAGTAAAGTAITLQPCGVGPGTLWIVDSSQAITNSYVPLISATDTNFSTPYVLTSTSTSAGQPLETETLQENSAGTVAGDQLWSLLAGSLPAGPGPLTVTTTSLPVATGGRPYSTSLTAAGGISPYSWSVSSGSLPPGLTLNSSTGQISGTPHVAGTYSFTVTVSDSESPEVTVTSGTLSISVSGPVITALRPDRGLSFGGNLVKITGTGLACPRGRGFFGFCQVSVRFGNRQALVLADSPGRIWAIAPPGRGTVAVTVTVGGVSNQATPVALYRYTYRHF